MTKLSDVIFDNGKTFSGGEKKKAIIMKLLARKDDVSVILLDEIEKALLEHKENYIILKISHGNISNKELYNKTIEL